MGECADNSIEFLKYYRLILPISMRQMLPIAALNNLFFMSNILTKFIDCENLSNLFIYSH